MRLDVCSRLNTNCTCKLSCHHFFRCTGTCLTKGFISPRAALFRWSSCYQHFSSEKELWEHNTSTLPSVACPCLDFCDAARQHGNSCGRDSLPAFEMHVRIDPLRRSSPSSSHMESITEPYTMSVSSDTAARTLPWPTGNHQILRTSLLMASWCPVAKVPLPNSKRIRWCATMFCPLKNCPWTPN